MHTGFFGILGVVFVILKLCAIINWSWMLVLLPFYGPIVIGLIIMAFGAICLMLAKILKRWS